VARGFNSGISYALKRGAEFVVMANNDTKFDEEAVSEMVKCVQARPAAAVVIPKIFYYDEPRTIWAAGSRFRRFPPAIIQNRTTDDDDGRFDGMGELAFAPYCITLFTREVLQTLGLLDTNYHFFYEDYDFCQLARDRGYVVAFAPASHAWHKISKTIKSGGKGNAKFYRIYGRSHAIFSRKFTSHREMTGWVARCYLYARTLYEGGLTGLRAFHEGMRKGAREELVPIPPWDVADEAHMIDYSRPGK
jgi:GT2 family glycosyltransferase